MYRRAFLRWAAGATLLMAGCAPAPAPAAKDASSSRNAAPSGPHPIPTPIPFSSSAPAVPPGTLVVASNRLYPQRDVLTKAWAVSGAGFPIAFRPSTTPGTFDQYMENGDVLEVPRGLINNLFKQNFTDLEPLLTARNFPLETFLAGTPDVFREGGGLRALPLILGEFQLFVNAPRIQSLGLTAPARWTFDAMVQALDRAYTLDSTGSAPLVAGVGWGDYRLWGGLMLGMGGSIVTSGGRVDLTGATQQTQRLVDMARRYRWDPNDATNPQNRNWADFYNKGFTGAIGEALFAFLPSYLVYGGGEYPPNLDPQTFPLLPAKNVVPAWDSVGLGLSPVTKAPDQALDLLLWFFQPEQQKYFASLGWPPAVQSVALSDWPAISKSLPAATPKFDAAGYTDILRIVGHDGQMPNPYALEAAISRFCTKMYDGDDVPTSMQTLQKWLTGVGIR